MWKAGSRTCRESRIREWSGMRWAFLISFFAVAVTAAEKPNIILIMADDVGYECFGCYGSEQYSTPNIDRMAEQGMRFENAHS